MNAAIILREFHDDRKVVVAVDFIASLEEAYGNTTKITLKDGRSWRVFESVSKIIDLCSTAVSQ